MKQNKMFFAFAGFALTAALATPAQAADPKGTCPGGWTLVGVDKAKSSPDARKVDSNHDQYVCENSTAGTPTYRDNDKARDKDKDKDKDKPPAPPPDKAPDKDG